jgi:hypothetical protein
MGACYDVGMTVEQLRKMYAARPFQPFDIHMVDGRSISLDHPELLGFSKSGRTIAVGGPDDAIEIIDLLLVTSLKPHPTATGRKVRQRGPSVG